MDGKAVSGQEGQDGLFASAVWDADAKAYIVKVVNTSSEPQAVRVKFDGLKSKALSEEVKAVSLHSDDKDAENTLQEPDKVTPQEVTLKLTDGTIDTTVGPLTLTVYTVKKK
jgi:alpha-L-arabinofuranosidase